MIALSYELVEFLLLLIHNSPSSQLVAASVVADGSCDLSYSSGGIAR